MPPEEWSADASAPKPSLLRRSPSGPKMEREASCLMPESRRPGLTGWGGAGPPGTFPDGEDRRLRKMLWTILGWDER